MKRIQNRELRKLMAEFGLDKQDIARIIGKSYRQTSKILHADISPKTGKRYNFDIPEAFKIVKHFKSLGAEVTMDSLFFADMLSNESDAQKKGA